MKKVVIICLILFSAQIARAQSADFQLVAGIGAVSPTHSQLTYRFTLPDDFDPSGQAYVIFMRTGNYQVRLFFNPPYPSTDAPGCYPANADRNVDSRFLSDSLFDSLRRDRHYIVTPGRLHPGQNTLMICYDLPLVLDQSVSYGLVLEHLYLHFHRK